MKSGEVLLDRYKVIEELGKGYTGTVYLCEDLHLPGKQWALKVVGSKTALRREVEILVSLRHRNLPTVVDNFELEGQQFLVLEFVEGENLSDLVDREGPVGEFEALRWAVQVARTLEYLHQRERPVIFRDLRPERVIVTPDRAIKLVDFGLARYHEPGQTRRTVAKGAVGYSPPEQWKQPGMEEPTADIYSLGATLYFALTGQPPPPTGRISWPADRAPSAPTRSVIERCLQQRPQDRYPDAAALVRELEAILRRASTKKQGRGGRGVFVAVLLVVMLAAGASWWLARPPEKQESNQGPFGQLAALQRDTRERAELLLARGETEEALALLSQATSQHPEDALAHILKANAYAALTAKEVWRVPVLTSLTGTNSGGYALLYGLALAQEEINRQNSPGNAVVLDVYDDRSETERAIQLAQRITKNPEYRACIGPFSSGLLLAVAQLFNAASLPLISPTASDPRAFHAGPYVVPLGEDENPRFAALARLMQQESPGFSVCLVSAGNLHSRSIGHMYASHFDPSGVATLSYRNSFKELKKVAAQALSKNPTSVFIADYQSDFVNFLATELRAGGFKGTLAVGTPPFAREAIEDTVTTTYWQPDPTLSERFQAHFGPEVIPSYREALGYDSLKLLYQQRQSQDLVNSLKEQSFEGVTGRITPSQAGENGRPVYVVRRQNGTFSFELVQRTGMTQEVIPSGRGASDSPE